MGLLPLDKLAPSPVHGNFQGSQFQPTRYQSLMQLRAVFSLRADLPKKPEEAEKGTGMVRSEAHFIHQVVMQ